MTQRPDTNYRHRCSKRKKMCKKGFLGNKKVLLSDRQLRTLFFDCRKKKNQLKSSDTAAAVGFSHKLVINQSRRVEIEQERERKKSGI